jgi:hypothetical protein
MDRVFSAVIKKGQQYLILKKGSEWGFLKLSSENEGAKEIERCLGIKSALLKTGKPVVEMQNEEEWELKQFLFEHKEGMPRGECKWVSKDELSKLAPGAATNLWILEYC